VSQKNFPPLACYNFDKHERILILFGRNVTDKVGNQKTLYYATSSNLCLCTTWQNGEYENHIFHSNAVLVESAAAVGLCCMHNAPVRCLSERKNCHVFDSVYSICWNSKIDIPLILSIDFHSRLDEEQLPSFIQQPTPWQIWLTYSMWITDSRNFILWWRHLHSNYKPSRIQRYQNRFHT